MNATRRRVLKMLHDHTLDVDQAEELLDAIDRSTIAEPAQAAPDIIGNSAFNQEFLATLRRMASMDAHVLIQGERGTGKALTARAVHAHSRRAAQPFLTAFCGESPDTLGAELFGVDRGDRSPRRGLLEMAHGGSLLLDMVEDCPPEIQRRLSGFLESGCFTRDGDSRPVFADVRLMCATHGGLQSKVEAGSFQSLLYYQLSASVLQTPSLRDRPEDIPTLVEYFLARRAERDGQAPRRLSKEALALLVDYEWPHNVAQLSGMVERAVGLCEGEVLETQHFPDLAA